MSLVHPEMEALVSEVNTLIATSPMSAATFGHLALGDYRLVTELRRGRRLKPQTVERVRAALEKWLRIYAERARHRADPAFKAAVDEAVARKVRPRPGPPRIHPIASNENVVPPWWHPDAAPEGSRRLAEAMRRAAA
jgi:hypothetical protein